MLRGSACSGIVVCVSLCIAGLSIHAVLLLAPRVLFSGTMGPHTGATAHGRGRRGFRLLTYTGKVCVGHSMRGQAALGWSGVVHWPQSGRCT